MRWVDNAPTRDIIYDLFIHLFIYLLSTYLSSLFIIVGQVGWVDIAPPEGIHILFIYLFVH